MQEEVISLQRADEAGILAHAGSPYPEQGVGWLVLRLRPLPPAQSPDGGLYEHMTVFVPCSVWIQPGILGYPSGLLPYAHTLHIHTQSHSCAGQVTPRLSTSQLPAEAPIPLIPDKACLFISPVPVGAPGTCHSLLLVTPQTQPRGLQEGCLWACLPWNGLCSWRLVVGPGVCVFFQCLLD